MAGQDSFDGLNVEQLYDMIKDAKPGSLTTMAAKWNAMAKVDNDVAYEEQNQLNTLSAKWKSPQAQPVFVGQVGKLVDTMYALGVSAPNVGSALTVAAGALGTAQTQLAKIYQQYLQLSNQGAVTGELTAANIAALQQLQQQAVQVMTTLAATYRAQLKAIPATPPYTGPQGVNGGDQQSQQTTATTNASGTTQFGSNATTQQGTTQNNGSAVTNQAAANPASLNAATTPTSLATATPTTPTTGTLGSVGGTGTTIPPVSTIGTTPIGTTTPFTGVAPVVPVAALPAESGGGGGLADEIGVGGVPDEVLPVAALPAETLPGAAGGTALAEPGAGAGSGAGAADTGMMPFLPGGAGGYPGGDGTTNRPRRPGTGLFDDEPADEERRVGPGGVIETSEEEPVLPYGVTGGGRERERDRRRSRSGAADAWDDGGAVAPAVLTADPAPYR